MKPKIICKMMIDFIMTALILVLMAYNFTGDVAHEWLGTGMFVLFIIHNILNFKWYKNLLKGKYSIFRILQTIINLLAFASMIALMISGIILSRYVFAFLSISGGMPFARTMHIVASYWGLVLMSMHMGLHWGMIIGITCKLTKKKKLLKVSIWILRAAAAAIAVYGAICFYKENIVSYMFLKNQFAFFDFEQSSVSVFAENIAMMGLWTFVAYYAAKLIQKPLYKKRRQNAL